MRFIIRLIILFVIALAIAGVSLLDSGVVLIYIHKYQIKLSLNLLILLVLLIFTVIYYLLRVYINLKRLPNKIQRSRAKNLLISSRKHLNYAGLHFFEGKYRSCYDSAMKSIKKELNVDNKFLAYMLAYKSASIMRDQKKEEEITDRIQQFNDHKWLLAKYLLIAENLYNQQKFGLCIDNLQEALKIDHKHVPAHFMLLKVYLNLNNYAKAYEMLEWLLKNDSIREYKANKYKLRVISGLFKDCVDLPSVKNVYNKLDKSEKKSFQYGKLYFDALLKLSAHEQAIKFLQDNHDELGLQLMYAEAILSLSKVINDKILINALLKLAEKSLLLGRENFNLLVALGIISYKLKIWGKAKSYLESALMQNATQDCYVFLALVAKEIADTDLLSRTYEQMLNFSLNKGLNETKH